MALDPFTVVPNGLILSEKHIGNVARGNRAEVQGIMNPSLTRYRNSQGQPLAIGEIDNGKREDGTPDPTQPGLSKIMDAASNTVKTWFGLARNRYGNCVPRAAFLNRKGEPKTWEQVYPDNNVVTHYGVSLADRVEDFGDDLVNTTGGVTDDIARRAILAACLCGADVPNAIGLRDGLARVDEYGEWAPAVQGAKTDKRTGDLLVYRDVYTHGRLAAAVLEVENMRTGTLLDSNNLPYSALWLRFLIADTGYSSELQLQAELQGIRRGINYDLLENPRGSSWFVIVDRCYTRDSP